MQVIQEHVTHPDRALRFLRFECDGFRAPRHRHHALELTWIERGSGLRLLGDSAEPFEDGDLVLIGPQVPHAWLSAQRGAGVAAATVVQCSPALLNVPALPELMRAAPLLAQAALGLRIQGRCHGLVIEQLKAMAHADEWGALAAWVRVLGLLVTHRKDLRTVARSAMGGAVAKEAPETVQPQRRIDQVIAWIHRHSARELSLPAAARLAHVAPASFSRWFRREAGKTFTEYVNDVRCSAACLALRHSAKPVARLAEECGFATLSHFNQQFKRRMGLSPRAYRAAA